MRDMYGAPGKLSDALALEVLARYGISPLPAIDIDGLATAMGVSAVLREPLLEEGRIDRDAAGRVVVRLRAEAPVQRQRFTLAHELGHLILMSDDAMSFTAQRTRTTFTTEESLCDSLAGGLLMPRPWVRERFAGRDVDLSVVQELARDAAVSLAAAVVRLREVVGWRYSLLHWTADAEVWRFDGQAGVFPTQRRSVRSLSETSSHLTYCAIQLAHRGGEVIRCNLPLAVNGQECELPAQLNIRWGSAVALVCLPDSESGRGRRRDRPSGTLMKDKDWRKSRRDD